MNLRMLALGLVPMIALTSCDESINPVVVTETRSLTSYDDESNLAVAMPNDWRRVPSSKFRDFNCKFNQDGEVYISIGSGDIKSNAERWLTQFADTRTVVVSDLEKLDVMGSQAVILESEGTFAGMRGINIEDAGLLGLLVETRGNLITVKMIGKKEEVQAQRANFIAFCQSIQWK